MGLKMAENHPYRYFSTVSERRVDWLWYPYIPYGKITVLQGDPGEGKSTFMINLAAAISCGSQVPFGKRANGKSETVIYQCAEDSLEDTIKPRLVRAGADCSRVAYIDDQEQSLTLDDTRLEDTIQATGARLLVLDPIQAFIGPECDFQNASKMRGTLRHLASVAERHSCAVVLVGHMNKASGGKHLYRGLGSIDIAAIARSVLMITRDQDNPSIRYMFPIKSSLAPEGKAVAFLFDEENGFHWIGPCVLNQEGINMQPPGRKKERVRDLIRLMLSSGDQASNYMFEQLEQLGFSEKTIKLAKKELGVETYRKAGAWYWRTLLK